MSCFALHDWSDPYPDPFTQNMYQPIMQCLTCGMIQRYYGQNFIGDVQLHQQGWNIRPDKPFNDIPESKKGWAG